LCCFGGFQAEEYHLGGLCPKGGVVAGGRGGGGGRGRERAGEGGRELEGVRAS